MEFNFTMQQKHKKLAMIFTDTMSYCHMMLMIDLISKKILMPYGGVLMSGGLDMLITRERILGLVIMQKMNFALICSLSGIFSFMMVLIGILQEMIFA